MDALLILGGMLIFLAALVWLVMRAFDTSLLWGWGSLIPPVTLLFVLKHWRKAKTPVFLAGLAAGTVLVGVAQMTAQRPDKVAEILSLGWMHPQQPSGDLDIQLAGNLNGQRFSPQQGELINGVMTLREGQDFYASRELIIRLPEQPAGPLKLDVLPQDAHPGPEIELNWLLPEQDLPEARRISRGYSLRLDLQPVGENKLAGDFHLVLPARFKTSLSGKVELYTDRLRYRDGKPDARHDSRDTLAWVIADYLQRRFRTAEVELAALPPIKFSASTMEVGVSAVIKGQSLDLPLQLEKDQNLGWRVANDRYPALAAEPEAVNPASSVQPEAEPAVQTSLLDRRKRFSLRRLLLNPAQYENLMLRVESERGVTAQGRFIGLSRDGELIIRSPVSGAGEASFNVQPDEVVSIELLEP